VEYQGTLEVFDMSGIHPVIAVRRFCEAPVRDHRVRVVNERLARGAEKPVAMNNGTHELDRNDVTVKEVRPCRTQPRW
jgi:hypothetical protein